MKKLASIVMAMAFLFSVSAMAQTATTPAKKEVKKECKKGDKSCCKKSSSKTCCKKSASKSCCSSSDKASAKK